MDATFNNYLLFALLPIVAVVCLALNMMLRARGGRSFSLNLEGFGIKLRIEMDVARKEKAPEQDASAVD